MLHLSYHLQGPPLDLLQEAHVFHMLTTPGLGAVPQMGSHGTRIEKGRILSLALCPHCLGQPRMMLGLWAANAGHAQPLTHKNPQVFSTWQLSVCSSPSLNLHLGLTQLSCST